MYIIINRIQHRNLMLETYIRQCIIVLLLCNSICCTYSAHCRVYAMLLHIIMCHIVLEYTVVCYSILHCDARSYNILHSITAH